VVDAHQLEQAMAEAREKGDIEGYVRAEEELERPLIEQAGVHLVAFEHAQAVELFERVADLNRELIAVLDAEGAKADPDQVARWKAGAIMFVHLSAGRAAQVAGQQASLNRNPGMAVEHFAASEREFREGAAGEGGDALGAMADHAQAMQDAAIGMESFVRGVLEPAANAYMRASARLQTLLSKLDRLKSAEGGPPEWLADIEPVVRLDASTVAAQFERVSYMVRLGAGDYGEAAEHAERLHARTQESLDAVPPEAPEFARDMVRAFVAEAISFRERATAFVLREEERWEEAEDAYERARAQLGAAAMSAVATGLPQGAAMQEYFMSQGSTTIPADLRQMRAERELKEELRKLRDERASLMDKVRSTGVTVNNVAEANATASASVDVVIRIEQTVRNTLGDLRAALDRVDLGPDGEQLKQEAAQLEGAPEKGTSFLERAKAFTQRVVDVVKQVGEAAKPVMQVVAVLAPLVGVPL
jgi:tetratricopeptide (TPR) repeat protein